MVKLKSLSEKLCFLWSLFTKFIVYAFSLYNIYFLSMRWRISWKKFNSCIPGYAWEDLDNAFHIETVQYLQV